MINPGVKSTSGVFLTNGKVYEIRTGMDDSDKFDRIPDEDLLTLVQNKLLSISGTSVMHIPVWHAKEQLPVMLLLPEEQDLE